jgi:quinol monooxygenase YgiN
MADGTLVVVAYIKAKAGREEEVERALLDVVAPTRAEQGCINYDLHRSSEDPSLFLFHETWASREALDRHFETPHLKALGAKADDLFDGPVEITYWEMISPKAGG